MKVRESDMPAEELWESFFKPSEILSALEITNTIVDVAEFGCGYGTFTIPTAKVISGKIYALDIEPEMVNTVKQRGQISELVNVVAVPCDFIADGSGLADASVEYVMLFNILHDEQPERILREAYRILTPGGRVGIIHWKNDNSTPRGPPMEIRPKPDQVYEWAMNVGFTYVSTHDLRTTSSLIIMGLSFQSRNRKRPICEALEAYIICSMRPL